MENYKKNYEGRRDYGHSSEKTYSSEGRVLRPRKNTSSPESGQRTYGERRQFGDRPQSGERREGRPFGERRQFGDRPQSGERREGRPFGERRQFGDRPQSGERREGRPFGERRQFGDRPQSGERREGRPFGERRQFGDRNRFGSDRRQQSERPYGGRGNSRKSFEFNDKEEGGINRMLSRKPQLNTEDYEGKVAETVIKDEVRLNKFIANSGVCSRREADTLIEAGVVTVNGVVVTELGTKINIHEDDVRFNGERLKGEQKVYIVMNKPKGYVTTASDPHADKTVMELLKGCNARVFPVGRLDKATTGVLMFTNDGEIAEKLTHPSYDKKKIYQVMLDKDLSQEDYDSILNGITLSDGDIKADELEFIDENDHRKLGIEIHSGKNRIVRRIFDALGYDVRALDRVYFAGFTKKGLKKGEWRYLSEGEVNILKMGAYM